MIFLNKLNIEKKKFEKVILWMPTWRRHVKKGNNSESKIDFPVLNSNNIHILNHYLEKENILLIIKLHPNQYDLKFLHTKYSNIKVIKNEDLAKRNIELYQIFSEVDALLTDYSSVFFDFLLTMKPIGFVIEDINDYGNKRGFVIENPLEIMPGEKIYNLNELLRFLNNIRLEIDDYYQERLRVNYMANKYRDGNSCKRIIEYLKM